MLEFYKEFGRPLVLEDLESMRDPVPEDEKSEEYAEKTKLLTWYFDSWLPATAGIEHYSSSRRCYFKATDPVEGVAPGRPRVAHVPVHAEAMALVLLENCQSKWAHIVPEKVKNPNWKVPAYKKSDKSTHKYNSTKWSDSKTGRIENGGWDAGAIKAFAARLKELDDFRRADKKKRGKDSFYKRGLTLLRKKHGTTEKMPPGDGKKKRGKKRKATTALESLVLDIPDVEDSFSVHSSADEEEAEEGEDE